jgi:nucleoside 2-deoxyribosyltransferase
LFNILKHTSLPKPAELANNLILLLGDTQSSPGAPFKVPRSGIKDALEKAHQPIYAKIGTGVNTGPFDFAFVKKALVQDKIIESDARSDGNVDQLSLTLSGWKIYEELKRSVKDTRKAFMAMEFINPKKDEGNHYYFQKELFDYLKREVLLKTEYKLENPLMSDPEAGNIHARLEVEIRSSRFVVAELSHHNLGAYWEAGFARGLGKPVIYMCNKEVYERDKPHFDVGSDQIVFWEEGEDKKEAAATNLSAVILATLLGEAKMTDG